MQWLIDIIKEIIHGQLGYFYRGDPATFDFDFGDFIQDGTWREVDFSTIVPANTKSLALRCQVRSAAANKTFRFRYKGQVNDVNTHVCRTVVANLRHVFNLTVNVDSDRKAEYHSPPAGFNILNFTVTGWWLQ